MPTKDNSKVQVQAPIFTSSDELRSLLNTITDIAIELHNNIIGDPHLPAETCCTPSLQQGPPETVSLRTNLESMKEQARGALDVLVSIKVQLK